MRQKSSYAKQLDYIVLVILCLQGLFREASSIQLVYIYNNKKGVGFCETLPTF
jgi:hypothetical protein